MLREEFIKKTKKPINPLINEKLQERKRRIEGTERSNCIGTALYVAGLQKTDRFRSTKKVWKVFNDLTELEEAQIGCIIAWKRQGQTKKPNYDHAGIVIATEPTIVLERYCAEGEVMETEVEKIDLEYALERGYVKTFFKP